MTTETALITGPPGGIGLQFAFVEGALLIRLRRVFRLHCAMAVSVGLAYF